MLRGTLVRQANNVPFPSMPFLKIVGILFLADQLQSIAGCSLPRYLFLGFEEVFVHIRS